MPLLYSSGLLLLDKPSGPTSHDAVLWARRALGTKKVGHCGSLDPLATGLLLVVVGDAVKLQDRLMAERKTYKGHFRLGLTTDTDDISGKPLPLSFARKPDDISESDLREIFLKFSGKQNKQVPRYSAVKVGGERLYQLARQGIQVDLPKKEIQIHRFDLLSFSSPDIEFFVDCSKGTYVRSLARDIGNQLGTGATLLSLCRESIGSFSRGGAFSWDGQRETSSPDLKNSFIPYGTLQTLLNDVAIKSSYL